MTILESDDGKFVVNSGREIFIRRKISYDDVICAIDASEQLYREALYSTLSGPAQEAHSHPFNSAKRKPKTEGNNEKLIRSSTETKNTRKFLYIKSFAFSKDWLQQEGYLPSSNFRGQPRSRLPKGFPVAQTFFDMPDAEIDSFLSRHILEPDTRVGLSAGIFESSLEIDFEAVVKDLERQESNRTDISTALNHLLEGALTAEKGKNEKRGFSTIRRAQFHILHYLAHDGQILLPTSRMADTRRAASFLYPAIMRGPVILRMTRQRTSEFLHAHQYCRTNHPNRSVSSLNNFSIFCGTTYFDSSGFEPEYLYMTRNVMTGEKHDLSLYLSGCADFHGITSDTTRQWMQKFKERKSKLFMEDPLAFFTEEPQKIKIAMPVQVQNFEEKTGKNFPNSFPPEIISWAYDLDRLVKLTPRRSFDEIYRSCRLWLMYLFMHSNPPRDFSEVVRSEHISDHSGKGNFTFKAALEQWEVTTRGPLRSMHQLFDLWADEQKGEHRNPIQSGRDWKNPPKKFGTTRKSIPSLIVETLIEENAKPDDDGLPYARYRRWKSGTRGRSLINLDGKQPEEIIPATAGALDCILNLGMRSSSARWMDSGQGDEFRVDKMSRTLVQNAHISATKGRRAGAIQIMDISDDSQIFSLLLLKTKNDQPLEIPFLPDDLHGRLEYIADIQSRHNPISEPVAAVDEKSSASLQANNLYIYPLFLNPLTGEHPISANSLHYWWHELLKVCEDIVHEKRVKELGPNAVRLTFFDKSGNPIWDIHSIRVAVATALLDQGVPPTVVQHFLGHASLVMTLHYHAYSPERVHAEINAAREARRVKAARALSEAESEDELDSIIEGLFGGLAAQVGSGEGLQLAKELITKRGPLANSPDAISVFSHGICPGASCSSGGEKKGSYNFGVHRDKACSRCRFRLTGPAFLNGLVMNANILILEIGDSVRKEQQLNTELLNASRAGEPVGIIETRISQERSFRDELWADWAAEYKTIDECVKLQEQENSSMPVELGHVSHGIREGDLFDLVQTIVSNTDVIFGARMDMPTGLVERRNEMLWEIAARNGDVGQYLLSLPESERREAMDRYGALIASVPENRRAEVSVSSLREQLETMPPPSLSPPTDEAVVDHEPNNKQCY